MIRNILLSTALPILLSITLKAQTANYDVYMAQYEEGAGSTIFNKDLKQTAPVSGYPYVLITGVKFKDCQNGIPSEKELSNLYRVSDSVYANVTTLVKNIMAGTFTYQCERLEYYYVMDTANIRQRLTTLYQKHYSTYEPYINIREDKNWDAYLKFLYPNEETLEFMQNEKLVIALEQQGDQHGKERNVDHWVYFTTEKDMNCFISSATQQGFKVAEKGMNKDKAYKVRISRIDSVDLPSVNKITTELRKDAKQCNGIYDGWETMVIK